MFFQELFFHLMLDVSVVVFLNIVYHHVFSGQPVEYVSGPIYSPYLPPDLLKFLEEMKKTFVTLFPENQPNPPGPGRPRLKRLPLFLTWTWNRVYYQRDTQAVLNKVNRDRNLREFFEIPPTGLKATTYDDFTKKELQNYLEPLIQGTIKELHEKKLVKFLVTAMDDLPVDSPLNVSKSIDFVGPDLSLVKRIFQALPSLTDMEEQIGAPPNTRRGWTDYLKLYLLYLLWGFPSQDKFDKFLKATPQVGDLLQLTGKRVLSTTLFPYIRQLEALPQAEIICSHLLSKVWACLSLKVRNKLPSPPSELGMLHGILGNSHHLKDYGAALHYNSSKGKYYFGRIARIIIDTWSQIPLWITVTSTSHPLAKDLEDFGHQLTQLLPRTVRPLLLLLDQGFRGTERMNALRRGFHTIQAIILTPAYKRANPSPNILRTERLALERTIGHLEVHLHLEHPRQLGTRAAQNWVLGAVFLMQRIVIYNHNNHPERSPIAIRYLKD